MVWMEIRKKHDTLATRDNFPNQGIAKGYLSKFMAENYSDDHRIESTT